LKSENILKRLFKNREYLFFYTSLKGASRRNLFHCTFFYIFYHIRAHAFFFLIHQTFFAQKKKNSFSLSSGRQLILISSLIKKTGIKVERDTQRRCNSLFPTKEAYVPIPFAFSFCWRLPTKWKR